MDRCGIPRCRDEASIVYLGRGLCERHWNEYTADDVPDGQLRVVLSLPPVQDAAVDGGRATMDGQKTAKSEQTEAAPAKGKARTKKAAPVKATAKAEAPAKVKEPKEPVEHVVFALRVPLTTRTRLHEVAGSGKASRFMLGAMNAAIEGDVEGFRKLIATRVTK
jgi:hypothetical protein